MSISKDLDEVSACIVCPKCKVNSPKDWFVIRHETTGKPRVRKSKVYFRCVICDYSTKIFDRKLIKFIDKELMMDDSYDRYASR
jgi:hypothetical protein